MQAIASQGFQTVWLYYIKNDKNSLQIQQALKKSSQTLGIEIPFKILSQPSQINVHLNSGDGFTTQKIGLFGFKKIKKLQNSPSIDLEKQQFPQRQELNFLQKNFSNVKFYYYEQCNQKEILLIIQKNHSQIIKFSNYTPISQTLQFIYHKNNGLNNLNNIVSYILRFFSVLSDQLIFKKTFQKQLQQFYKEDILEKQVQNMQKNPIEWYQNSAINYSIIKRYFSSFRSSDNCEKIGYINKKIYQKIKKAELQPNFYQQQIQVWNLFQFTQEQIQSFAINSFYFHKTFEIYSKSMETFLFSNKLKQINNNYTFVSIRLNRKKNQGSYISANSDTVIVNSMNILRCVNKKDYRLLNLVKDPALNFKLQYELKNKSIYIITFQIVSNENRLPNQIQKLFNFIQMQPKIQLQQFYLNSNQFTQLIRLLEKKEQKQYFREPQFWKKIGKQQILLSQFKKRILLEEKIDLCRELYRPQQLFENLEILEKHLDTFKISQFSQACFNKFCKRGEVLLEMSLIQALYLKDSPFFQNFQKAIIICEQLAPLLSHSFKLPEEEVNSSWFRCFESRQRQKSEFEIKNLKNQNLCNRFFPNVAKNQQIEYLRKLKIGTYNLFTKLVKTYSEMKSYGIKNKNNKKINDKIKQLRSQFNRMLQLINYKPKQNFIQILEIKQIELNQIEINQQKQNFISYLQIIDSKQNVDRQSTIANFSSLLLEKQKSKTKKVEEKFHAIEAIISNKIMTKQAFKQQLHLLNKLIKILKLSSYSNDSILLLKIYKRQSQIYYKLNMKQQLQQLLNIQFIQDKDNINIFYAEIYQKLANLNKENENFQNCIINIEKSLKYYQKIKIKKYHHHLLIIQKIKTKIELIELKYLLRSSIIYSSHHLDLQQISINNNNIKQQIQKLRIEMKKQLQKIKINKHQQTQFFYQIEMNSIFLQLKKIQITIFPQENTEEQTEKLIIQTDKLQKDIYLFYQQNFNLKLLVFKIQEIRLIYEKQKLRQFSKKVQASYNYIKSAFNDDNFSIEIQQAGFKWILNISQFYYSQLNDQQLFGLLPIREHIERCLFDFKQMNQKSPLGWEIRKYYQKNYEIYSKFMQKSFKYFPKKLNILEESTNQRTQTEENEIFDDQQGNNNFLVFSKVHWVIFLKDNDINIQINKLKEQLKIKIIFNIKQLQKFILQNKNDCIKIIIDIEFLNNLISCTQLIKNVSQFKILIKPNSDIQLIQGHLFKEKINCRVGFITNINQLKFQIIQQKQQPKQLYNLLPNCIFYNKELQSKLFQYHTIMLSTISQVNYEINHEIQKGDSLEFLIRSFCAQSYRRNQDNALMLEYLKESQKLAECHININKLTQNGSLKFEKKLRKISKKILAYYQEESFIYPLINNTIRFLYRDINFDWSQIYKLVFPLYHAIWLCSRRQIEQGFFSPGQTITLWRKAEMKQVQYLYFEKQLESKNFIQFLGFTSTSQSLQWIIQQFNKLFLPTSTLIKIEIQITDSFINYRHNHMFCRLQQIGESQILINIFNIFQIKEVKKQTIKNIIIQNANQSQYERLFKFPHLINKQLKFISLKMKDSSLLFRQKYQKDTPLYIFQQAQSFFIKKQQKHQKLLQKDIKFFNYSTEKALADLQKPLKAIQLLLGKLKNFSLTFEARENICLQIARNYLKMGYIKRANQILKEELPKYRELSDCFQNLDQQWYLEEQMFQMKFGLMQIFSNQPVNWNHQNIVDIQHRIQNIRFSSEIEELKKRTKLIYFELVKIIKQFKEGRIDKSITHYNKALNNLKNVIQNLSVLSQTADSQNIKKDIINYCQKIIFELENRKNDYNKQCSTYFKDQIKKTDLLKIQKSLMLFEKCKDNLQNNLIYGILASDNISDQPDNQIFQAEITHSEAQSLLSASELMEAQSSSIDQLQIRQKDQKYIKTMNFKLLAKLQSKKQQVKKTNAHKMELITKSYYKMFQKMIKIHLKYLKDQGYTRQSHSTTRLHNKILKQKIKMNFSISDIRFQLKKHFLYCNKESNHQAYIELSRNYLLQAQIEYLTTEEKLLKGSYTKKMIKLQDYNKVERLLNKAKQKLLLAYNINEQFRPSGYLFSCFRNSQQIAEEQKNQRKMQAYRMSSQFMAIQLMKLKIRHKLALAFATNRDMQSILREALQNFGNLLKQKRFAYNIIDEQIIHYQIYTIHALIISERPKFSRYSKKLIEAFTKRNLLYGENNIQNAIDSLELFELLNTNLVRKVDFDKEVFKICYKYIEKATHSVENNSLFWHFNICKFNLKLKKEKPKQNASEHEIENFITNKIQFLYQILCLLDQRKESHQLPFHRIQKSYKSFYNNYIKKQIINTPKVKQVIQKIQNRIKRLQIQLIRQRPTNIILQHNILDEVSQSGFNSRDNLRQQS